MQKAAQRSQEVEQAVADLQDNVHIARALSVTRRNLDAITQPQGILAIEQVLSLVEALGQLLEASPSTTAVTCLLHLLSTSPDGLLIQVDGHALLKHLLFALDANRQARLSSKLLSLLDVLMSRMRMTCSKGELVGILSSLKSMVFWPIADIPRSSLPRNPPQTTEIVRLQLDAEYLSSSEDEASGGKHPKDSFDLASKSLHCLATICHTHSRMLFEYWNTWLLCDPVEGKSDLLDLGSKCASQAVRSKAVLVVKELLGDMHQPLQIAEDLKGDSRTSYTAVSTRTARTIRSLHRFLVLHLAIDHSDSHLQALIALTQRLVLVTPYEKLRPGLLTDICASIVSVFRKRKMHARPDDMGVLACLHHIMSRARTTKTLQEEIDDQEISALVLDGLAGLESEQDQRSVLWQIAALLLQPQPAIVRCAISAFDAAPSKEKAARLTFLSTICASDQITEDISAVLLSAQKDCDSETRDSACPLAFEYDQRDQKTSFFFQSMQDTDIQVRIASLKYLAANVHRSNPSFRLQAAKNLCSMTATSQSKALGPLLDAIAALAKDILDVDVLKALLIKVRQCTDSTRQGVIKVELCRAIAALADNEKTPPMNFDCVQVLIDMLTGSSSAKVHWNAAQALGRIAGGPQMQHLSTEIISTIQEALSLSLDNANFKVLQKTIAALANFKTCEEELSRRIIGRAERRSQKLAEIDYSEIPFQQAQLLPGLRTEVCSRIFAQNATGRLAQ